MIQTILTFNFSIFFLNILFSLTLVFSKLLSIYFSFHHIWSWNSKKCWLVGVCKVSANRIYSPEDWSLWPFLRRQSWFCYLPGTTTRTKLWWMDHEFASGSLCKEEVWARGRIYSTTGRWLRGSRRLVGKQCDGNVLDQTYYGSWPQQLIIASWNSSWPMDAYTKAFLGKELTKSSTT